ncbi:MAG TPA: YfhO family protein, partial [Actinomycetota bacterium]|nr:YfhO family protein [Actinomycetota bacterium]
GHVQFSIYVWMAFGLWMAVAIGSDLWRARGSGSRAALAIIRRGAGVAAAPFVMAAGLASVQILGVAEFSQHIFRRTENYATVLGTALPYRHLPTILIPDYFGNPVDSNYAGPGINYTQLVLYMGLGTLVLASVGLLVRRDRIAAFFGILGLIGVLAALGTPFYKVLYVLVPGLSRTTHIARFIFFIHFALAGLAVLGLDALLRRRDKVRVAYWAVPAALAAVGIVGLGVTRVGTVLPGEYLDPRWVRGLLFALGFAALMVAVWRLPHRSELLSVCLVAVIAADLWAFGFRYHPFQAPRDLYRVTPEIAELKSLEGPRPRFAQIGASTLPFNAAQVHGIHGLNGYDPFLPDTFVEVLTLAEDQRRHNQNNLVLPFRPETALSPIFDLFGVEAFLHPKEGPEVIRGAFNGPFTVERNPDALPAAFLTRCWEVVPAGRVLERLGGMSTSELGSIAVLEAGPGVPAPPEGDACPPALAAAVPHYSAEEVRIQTPQAGASLLVLTDQWFNGWEATVDGKPARIYKADHAFRAVALSEGSHEVVFRFRPRWVPTGLAISALTALLTAAAVLVMSLRKRRRALPRPE